MNNLVKAEIFKLKNSTGFYILMILSVLFGISEAVVLAYGEMLGNGINMTGYEAFYSQFSELRTLILVFAGVFSGIFIGDDFACRTFQAEIALGHSRFKVLLSKTFVYMVAICMMIGVQVFIVTAGVVLVNGFGESATAYVIANMLRAVLMFMFQICACSMLCVFTSMILKNKGSILAVNFLLLILIDGLFQVFASISNKAFAIYAITPFFQALLSATSTISTSELIKSCSIGAVTSICFYLFSYSAFRKCELK